MTSTNPSAVFESDDDSSSDSDDDILTSSNSPGVCGSLTQYYTM